MIKGGYIIQPRIIENSDVMQSSPITREVWLYLLRNVNYKDNGKFKRGEGFFRLADIAEDLKWFTGFRKNVYSKSSLTKALRRLNEGNFITSTKETRGIHVKVNNYSYYQDASNYEGNAEFPRRKHEGNTKGLTILEESKESKEYNLSNDKLIEEFSVVLEFLNSPKGEELLKQNKYELKRKKVASKKEIDFEQDIIDFSDELIKNYFNEDIYPKSRKSSYEAIDKLIRIDKVQKEVIEEIVKSTKKDKFWDSNFLTLAKLRQKNKEGVEYWKVWGTKLVNSQQASKPTILNFDALDGLF